MNEKIGCEKKVWQKKELRKFDKKVLVLGGWVDGWMGGLLDGWW